MKTWPRSAAHRTPPPTGSCSPCCGLGRCHGYGPLRALPTSLSCSLHIHTDSLRSDIHWTPRRHARLALRTRTLATCSRPGVKGSGCGKSQGREEARGASSEADKEAGSGAGRRDPENGGGTRPAEACPSAVPPEATAEDQAEAPGPCGKRRQPRLSWRETDLHTEHRPGPVGAQSPGDTRKHPSTGGTRGHVSLPLTHPHAPTTSARGMKRAPKAPERAPHPQPEAGVPRQPPESPPPVVSDASL